MKKADEKRRSFGGLTNNFGTKLVKALEKRHLKAYLKGYKHYTFAGTKFNVIEVWE